MKFLQGVFVVFIVLLFAVGLFGFLPPIGSVPGGEEIYPPADGVRRFSGDTQEQGNDTSGVEVVVEGLEIPWEVAFLPGGEMLVTERPGRLLKIGADKIVIEIEGVSHRGEGGLLGLAPHPEFEKNQFIYLYLTTRSGAGLTNRVERYRLHGNTLTEREVIIDDIPGAAFHDGGRIAFGPDGLLYITTGDAGNPESAQDINSLSGKILRMHDDGSIPEENPFTSSGSVQAAAVYSYGHRNPQGLAWDDKGRLWSTEHGRSGIFSGLDELNVIERSANYGWPDSQGDDVLPDTHGPVMHSGAGTTWAPAGAVYAEGRIFFVGLRGEAIYEAAITRDGEVRTFREHFKNEFGRLRALVIGPDGDFYVSTSNTDGRGRERAGDDKIIKIPRGLLAS